MNLENNFQSSLAEFIAIPTIAYNIEANQAGIEYVKNILSPIGFKTSIEGESPYHQPVIIAKYANSKSDKKVVLYGHYDVEKIKDWENWHTPPFELTENDGRLYCRGIADNKGILLARLYAMKEMFEANEEIPNILWIIQGEEEVEGKTPFDVIPKHYTDFGAKLYLEETGMFRDGTPLILHLPQTDKQPEFLNELNNAIYSGKAILENRKLNKYNECPFLVNIPQDGHYIAFGPNDGLCNIHKENESLNKTLLQQHKEVFKEFIRWVNKTTIL
jgi:acetylornithine deacetylase/succinyl-diaminopimelate desuccinylase-like protein